MQNSVAQQVDNALNLLNEALANGNAESVANCFQEECFWRDLLTFTWNIKTLEGRAQIAEMLRTQLPQISVSALTRDSKEPAVEEEGMATAWLVFETAVARGCGHIRVVDGKIFTLFTSMTELKGHEESVGSNRPIGSAHDVERNRTTWKEDLERERQELGSQTQPYALIVGGGQSGIVLGARLRMLGVPCIIIEKNDKPGDNWRKRYKSLCLHDPVWYDHLPYLPFPANWPVFTPKDKIGDWLEFYVDSMELNYWTNSQCRNASYDDEAAEWTVTIDRDGDTVVLRPKQLILATGLSGKVNMPEIKGMERFKGDQHHSSQHPGPDAWEGKSAVVIGSNNSAHDIAAALWEKNVDVTMVQRSSTHVVRSSALMELVLAPLYSEEAVANGMSTEKADMLMASLPTKMMVAVQQQIYVQIKERDAGFYQRLRDAGFLLDFGEDYSGAYLKYLRRGSGYYIDVGASELIANGQVKLKSPAEVVEITEDSVVFNDGSKLRTDLIVYATGYGNMSGWIEDLIDRNVAKKIGRCWGYGSQTAYDPGPWEGEQRNAWKPLRQEGLWIQPGNLANARFYSRYTALQIKARMEGIPTPVYGIPEAVSY